MPEGKAHITIWAAPEVLGDFRAAVAKKHGTTYRKINVEAEEALRHWTKVLNGTAKPPK